MQDAITALMDRFRSAVTAEVRLELAPAELKTARERTAVEARANLEIALRAVLPRRAESTSRMQAVTVPITISIEDESANGEADNPKTTR